MSIPVISLVGWEVGLTDGLNVAFAVGSFVGKDEGLGVGEIFGRPT